MGFYLGFYFELSHFYPLAASWSIICGKSAGNSCTGRKDIARTIAELRCKSDDGAKKGLAPQHRRQQATVGERLLDLGRRLTESPMARHAADVGSADRLRSPGDSLHPLTCRRAAHDPSDC